MQKVSNNKYISIVTTLLLILLCAKLVAVGVDWFLPQQGIAAVQKNSYVIPYRHIDFHTMLASKQENHKSDNQKKVSIANINTLTLRGLYGNDTYGYAIVAKKSSPNTTTIVGVGELYQSYQLKKIALDYVVFSRNNKEYILRLVNNTIKNKLRENSIKSIQNDNDAIAISRNDIKYYSNNIDNLDRDIAVDEVYQHGKIHGFKVGAIRSGSKLAQIGLQKGDVILKVNNTELTSYNDAFKIYQNLSKLQTIDLLIKRGNQEKELLYEIH